MLSDCVFGDAQKPGWERAGLEPIESEVEKVWAAAAGGPSELPAKE